MTTLSNETPSTSSRPAWSLSIKEGDCLAVRESALTRGGEQGYVLEPITEEGCGLDFECDVHGDPDGVPSIEFWEWSEIDTDRLPMGRG